MERPASRRAIRAARPLRLESRGAAKTADAASKLVRRAVENFMAADEIRSVQGLRCRVEMRSR